MATAVAAIGVGVGIIGAERQEEAQKKAARGIERTAIENVRFLEEQGQLGREFIQAAAQEAGEVIDLTGQRALAPIQRFGEVGGQAFDIAQQNILGGISQSPLGQSIQRAGLQAATVPGFDLTSPVRRELTRRSRLTGESLQPAFNQQLLGIGRIGVGAAGDIAGIETRRAELAGDITRQAAAQQASALIGQVPQIAQQLQTGQEARLLSDISGQQFQTGVAEQAAQLAGRVF